MHPSPPSGIYHFAESTEPSPEWPGHLRDLGFTAVALPGGPPPHVISAWREAGLEVEAAERVDGQFAATLAPLFSAAESAAPYAGLWREFLGDTAPAPLENETGLVAHEALPDSGADAVKRFQHAAETRSEADDTVLLPGLAAAETRARLLAAVADPVDWRQRVLR